MPSTNFSALVGLAFGLAITAYLVQIAYNLFLHPLARFPGPILFRASRIPYLVSILRGKLIFKPLKLHEKYGPIVRIAPNELSFADPEAWKTIYGHRTGNAYSGEEMAKYTLFYRGRNIPSSIIAENRENHTVLRRAMAPSFSDRSMREQEPIIGGYVSLLIQRLREHCVDNTKDADREGGAEPFLKEKRTPVNMTMWYNFTTFDIVGDLAFGESFHCLERAQYDPWVAAINRSVALGAVFLAIKYLGLEPVLSPIARKLNSARKTHMDNTTAKLKKRMAMDVERPDLIGGLLKKKDDLHLDFTRLRVNAGTLIVAGSETTATLLTGVTYLLAKHPETLKKLTDEVRSAFKSDSEITLMSVNGLEYMLACLNEALRIYPPAPTGFPRQVPKGGATITGAFVPEDTVVAVWHWSMYHDAKNFKDPFSFRPERFLKDPEFANDKVEALQPFSVGPRNCIGRNLAYAEMRLILARVVYNFDIELVDKENDWLNHKAYALWSKPELPIYLTPVIR